MAEKYIEVTVHPDGTVTAETHNLMGSSCLDYLAVLENLLDADAVSSAYTSDYGRSSSTVDLSESQQAHHSQGA